MNYPLSKYRPRAPDIAICSGKSCIPHRWLVSALHSLVVFALMPAAVQLFGQHRVFWQNGQWSHIFPAPGWTDAVPEAINNSGVIVGSAVNPLGRRTAVKWQNGVMTVLGSVNAFTESHAEAINNSGQIVGGITYYSNGSPIDYAAALWSNGTEQILRTSINGARATSINDSGTISGTLANKGVVWRDGSYFLISGTDFVYFVNNRDEMLVSLSGSPGGYAMIDASGTTPLHLPSSAVFNMNDLGQVVGVEYDLNGIGTPSSGKGALESATWESQAGVLPTA
jgi:hypothetical protein